MRKIKPKESKLLDFIRCLIPSFLKGKVDVKWEDDKEIAFLEELGKVRDESRKAIVVLSCPQQHLESRSCVCMDCPSLGACRLERSIKSHGCLEKFLIGCQHKYQMENGNEEEREGAGHSGRSGFRTDGAIPFEGDKI